MLFKKLLVYICPLLTIIGLELLVNYLSLIYFLIVLIFIFLIIVLKYLIPEKFLSRDFWYLAILPLLLFLTTTAFLLLLSSNSVRNLIIFIFALFFGIYLENIFLFFYRPTLYQSNSQENISVLFCLLIFFLLAIDLNSFNVFLNIPIWILSLILTLIVTILVLQIFWSNKIKSNFKFLYLIIFDIVILEVFWVLAFLPTNFYVVSIIITIIFYLLWGIFKAQLTDKLNQKLVWRYLIISGILLFFIIITSNWI
ncbi:MAG: hypothetical protein NTX00_02510 [Candidatus Parcubacteria bacterium]|nr:hypothetical protein [Candidatus Parcubacteria bacterium]